MLYFFDQDIMNENYSKLLHYALDYCDTITLRIRNYIKSLDGEKYFWSNDKESEERFKEHFYKVSQLTKELFGEHIVKIEHSAQYGAEFCGHENEIYTIAFNMQVIEKLLVAQSLFSWQGELPEDLCLFSKGKCWIESIAHEHMCYINDDSEELKALLREMNIDFINPNEDIIEDEK